jgi:hypothetical protein
MIEGPMNEAKPFTMRLRLPGDYRIPTHYHSAIEHVTAISGTFNMGTGDKLDTMATRALGPGSVAIMQPGTRHFAWTKEETVVQVHGMATGERGRPACARWAARHALDRYVGPTGAVGYGLDVLLRTQSSSLSRAAPIRSRSESPPRGGGSCRR